MHVETMKNLFRTMNTQYFKHYVEIKTWYILELIQFWNWTYTSSTAECHWLIDMNMKTGLPCDPCFVINCIILLFKILKKRPFVRKPGLILGHTCFCISATSHTVVTGFRIALSEPNISWSVASNNKPEHAQRNKVDTGHTWVTYPLSTSW